MTTRRTVQDGWRQLRLIGDACRSRLGHIAVLGEALIYTSAELRLKCGPLLEMKLNNMLAFIWRLAAPCCGGWHALFKPEGWEKEQH